MITGPNPTERLAITASSSTTPPRPCRFCGGNHWDRDCTYYRPKVTAYHLYQVDTTEEEYGDAEDMYESLQSEVFNNMDDDYKPEEENSDPEDDDKDQGTTATYQTTYTPSISQRSISQKSSATMPRHKPPVPANAEVTKINAVRHVFLNTHHISYICDTCQEAFTSCNLLFAHLKETNHFSSKETKAPVDVTVIQSKANPAVVASGYAFRDFNYCEIRYFFNL